MKLYESTVWLKKRFITDGKTIEEMAVEAKCSTNSIRNALRSKGLKK